MTFPLKELSRLLTQDKTLIGIVVEINNATIKVATPEGALTVPSPQNLKLGDRVLVRNGIATKAPVATHTFSV